MATSQVSARLVLYFPLTGTITSTSPWAAPPLTISYQAALQGTVVTQSGFTALLRVGPAVHLQGTLTSQSTMTALFAVTLPLQGPIQAQTTGEATLSLVEALAGRIQGESNGSAHLTPILHGVMVNDAIWTAASIQVHSPLKATVLQATSTWSATPGFATPIHLSATTLSGTTALSGFLVSPGITLVADASQQFGQDVVQIAETLDVLEYDGFNGTGIVIQPQTAYQVSAYVSTPAQFGPGTLIVTNLSGTALYSQPFTATPHWSRVTLPIPTGNTESLIMVQIGLTNAQGVIRATAFMVQKGALLTPWNLSQQELLYDNAINTALLAPSAVTGDKVATATLTGQNISGGSITGANIASATITGQNISGNTITGDLIAAQTISGQNIVAGTITSTLIASKTITASNIAAQTITAQEIAAATITGQNIAAATISGGNIVAGSISGGNIAAGTLTATNIAAGTITGNLIAAQTITASNIVSETITATQIAASTITAAQIAANTITANQIAANTITASQIAASTITSQNIAAGAITTSNLDVNALATFNGPIEASTLISNSTFDVYGGLKIHLPQGTTPSAGYALYLEYINSSGVSASSGFYADEYGDVILGDNAWVTGGTSDNGVFSFNMPGSTTYLGFASAGCVTASTSTQNGSWPAFTVFNSAPSGFNPGVYNGLYSDEYGAMVINGYSQQSKSLYTQNQGTTTGAVMDDGNGFSNSYGLQSNWLSGFTSVTWTFSRAFAFNPVITLGVNDNVATWYVDDTTSYITADAASSSSAWFQAAYQIG